jgi:hypothetical protein
MAQSPERQYLSQTFLAILENFSRSKLYSYRESDRGKFDTACMLIETWDYLLNGQALWKHSEGIDKDLRTLLIASDAPLLTYVARDTTRHRSTFCPPRSVTAMDFCPPSAWNVSWDDAQNNPSAAGAFSAMTCAIGAASACAACERTSCNRPVRGSREPST